MPGVVSLKLLIVQALFFGIDEVSTLPPAFEYLMPFGWNVTVTSNGSLDPPSSGGKAISVMRHRSRSTRSLAW